MADSCDTMENRVALSQLTVAARVRLVRVAQRFAFGCSYSTEDLLQQAAVRALTSGRTFASQDDMLAYLVSAMRSVAFDERKKTQTHALDMAESIDDDDIAATGLQSHPSAADDVMREEDDEARITALRQLMAQNENAALVLEGLLDGMKAAEIRDALGMSSTEYDSARTYIHRRMNAHFGKRPKT